MKKRPLACLLVLCLLATFLPVTAGAAEVRTPSAAPLICIYETTDSVVPVILGQDKPYYVNGEARAAAEDGTAPEGWTAFFELAAEGDDVSTLTLNGLKLKGKGAGVFITGHTNLVLQGENVIEQTLPVASDNTTESLADESQGSPTELNALPAMGNLTISGDGSLSVVGSDSGIKVLAGDLTVESGTVNATAIRPGENDVNSHDGIMVAGTITVNGGTVSGTSDVTNGVGIDAYEILVTGGTMAGKAGGDMGCGVLGGTVTVTGGAVTGEAGGDRGSGVVGVTTTVTGGTVTGSGGNEGYGVGGETITVNGGTVTGIGGANGTGILGKRIAVLDGTLQGESDNAEKTYYGVESYYDADETDQGLGIVVSGGRFIAKGGWCIASYAPDPDNEGKYIRTPYPIRVTADSYIYKLAGGAEQNGPREWTVEDGEQDVEIVCTKPEPTPPSSYDPPVNNTTTTTTKNEDGSTTTKTENKATGTVTETTKNPDGSQIKVETKKDGTVTTTETDATGNKTETVAKPDGSSVTKVEQKDGTTAMVNTDTEGKVEAEVSLPKEVVAAAQESGSAIALPIPEVKTAASTAAAPAVTVKTGSETPVKVLIPTVESKPGTVAILVKADGTEEIIKTSVSTGDGLAVALPDGATVKIVDNSKHFADMPADNWATDAVNFSSARELFSGTAPDTFSPDAPMTRAMLVTVLARFDGADTSGGSTWYEQGVDWAVSKGISDGSNINGNVSREQLAVMLWRYAGSPAPAGDLSGFQDGDAVSGYALDAMRWAVEKGIVSGFGDGQLGPQGQATRVQVAKMLMNFISAQ